MSSKWYNMGFKLNNNWTEENKISFIDGYKVLKADVKINRLEVNNLILNGLINNLSFTKLEGGLVQNAGSGRRRTVIDDIGSFTYNNEIITSTTLTNGINYILILDQLNNSYKNIEIGNNLVANNNILPSIDTNTINTFNGVSSSLISIPTLCNSDHTTVINKPVLFNGVYSSLTSIPTLFNSDYTTLINKPVLFDGNYNLLTNKPVLFDGNYTTLINKPVLFDGNYNLLTNKPVLFNSDYNSSNNRPTRFNGAYSSLTGVPTPYNLPPASSSIRGGFRGGTGLSISGGDILSSATYLLPIETFSGTGQFQQVFTDGTKLQDAFLGKFYISNNTSSIPEMLNNTMVCNLEVNGPIKIIGDIRFSGELYKNNV